VEYHSSSALAAADAQYCDWAKTEGENSDMAQAIQIATRSRPAQLKLPPNKSKVRNDTTAARSHNPRDRPLEHRDDLLRLAVA
jgi:hypothetical protein